MSKPPKEFQDWLSNAGDKRLGAMIFGEVNNDRKVDATKVIKSAQNKLAQMYYPLMDEFTRYLALHYDQDTAEDIACALHDLRDRINKKNPLISASDRGRLFVKALKSAVRTVENNFGEAAGSQEDDDSVMELPNVFETYVPRKSGRASDFLKEHWGRYIEAGACFRPDIKRLDPKLEMALANEFRGRTDELRAILPNQTDAADARLAREFGGPVRPEDRKAAITALSTAKRLKTSPT